MIPIFLWSVVRTQSTQRLVVRGAATSLVGHLGDRPGCVLGDRHLD